MRLRSTLEPPRWRAWWAVVIVAGCALCAAGSLWFMAVIDGASAWDFYVGSGLCWCVPLFLLARNRRTLGVYSRRLAVVLAVAGAGWLLGGLPDFVRSSGWQF